MNVSFNNFSTQLPPPTYFQVSLAMLLHSLYMNNCLSPIGVAEGFIERQYIGKGHIYPSQEPVLPVLVLHEPPRG